MAAQSPTIQSIRVSANWTSLRHPIAAQVADGVAVIKPGQVWVSTAQLARYLGVEERWVKDRKEHLGAMPLSDSPNAKYRYHLPTADAYAKSRMLRPKAPKTRPARRRQPARAEPATIDFV